MKLLISVKNLPEAAIAVDASVSIVDVKDPAKGPLGRANKTVLAEIGARFGNRCILSAALGEFVDDKPSEDWSYLQGFRFVKYGLSNWTENRFDDLAEQFLRLPRHLTPVPVCYADHANCAAPTPDRVFKWIRNLPAELRARFSIILVDTFDKSPELNLFSFLDASKLCAIVTQAHEQNLQIALAGSIKTNHLSELFALEADVVGVRGAVCAAGKRKSEMQFERIRDFQMRMARQQTAMASAASIHPENASSIR